ncbi:hypothetical protein J2Y45_006298 [Dyadobacter sp. BE34]|uniref:Uncharacterized protein n=1 Tax=Dyadobacter fermentans TaxID=94254 RepID=A0ABU1R6Q1_9BACT|nr:MULTISPECIES: hypothetical protein [Dyadobacter]MDR6809084.1 hypothetical protein [Dyadobacter fermentans]MDR7046827.1 hypothetical protein [Dyadobacter sp. BE242]MDR7201141.1 hypothetical protein [Dyadobacter sp. BE34]MDR7219101.1 hypothetical protein [Dyadobacter sp. BE31]MDR7264689.1 hypothetical protein [Dyadobacter sp. BE32]
MDQIHPESTGPDAQNEGNEESLADYVKRMETEENLRKLAQKLESDLKNPGKPDVSTPDVSTPDLSFEKFDAKRKLRGQ